MDSDNNTPTTAYPASIRGYLQSLPREVIMQTSARELMEAAPGIYPKQQGTWGQAVSTLRTQYRGGPMKQSNQRKGNGGYGHAQQSKRQNLGGNASSTQAMTLGASDVGIRQRVRQAVERELSAIQEETKKVRDEWTRLLGE
jgi:hypothetical protein